MSENLPKVGLRLHWSRTKRENKIPKYKVTMWGGDRAEMQFWHNTFTGRNGEIEVTFREHTSTKSNAPEMKIEAKNSFNITGVKQWWEDGKPTGTGYGEPYGNETYGEAKVRPNPLYPSRVEDSFLIATTPDKSDLSNTIPEEFELIVLKGKGASKQGRKYLTMLRSGGLNSILATLPMQEYRAEDFSNI